MLLERTTWRAGQRIAMYVLAVAWRGLQREGAFDPASTLEAHLNQRATCTPALQQLPRRGLELFLTATLGFIEARGPDILAVIPGSKRTSPVPAAAPSHRHSPQSDEATVAALAKQTGTPRHVVKRIYDEEIAALHADSTVKNFIHVIAGRRARQRLKALANSAH